MLIQRPTCFIKSNCSLNYSIAQLISFNFINPKSLLCLQFQFNMQSYESPTTMLCDFVTHCQVTRWCKCLNITVLSTNTHSALYNWSVNPQMVACRFLFTVYFCLFANVKHVRKMQRECCKYQCFQMQNSIFTLLFNIKQTWCLFT